MKTGLASQFWFGDELCVFLFLCVVDESDEQTMIFSLLPAWTDGDLITLTISSLFSPPATAEGSGGDGKRWLSSKQMKEKG